MSRRLDPDPASAGVVTVRFWASARAAAGRNQVEIPTPDGRSLADLVELVCALAPDPDALRRLLRTCSVLIDTTPAGRADRSMIAVPPGAVVEFLPPFAGG